MKSVLLNKDERLPKPKGNKAIRADQYSPKLAQFIGLYKENLVAKKKKTDQQIAILAGYSSKTSVSQILNQHTVANELKRFLQEKYIKVEARIVAESDKSVDTLIKLRDHSEIDNIKLKSAQFFIDKLWELFNKKATGGDQYNTYEQFIFQTRNELNIHDGNKVAV